jgi:hypothetical protein
MTRRWTAGSWILGALAAAAASGPLFAAANQGASDKAPPVFTGMWSRTGEPMFEPIPGSKEGAPVARLHVDHPDAEEIMAGNADNPVLQPWARDIVKKNAEREIALDHVFQADDSCWPVTVPAILNMREAVQFLHTKDRITILYQRDHQIRRIWLNQKHRPDAKPTWYGESVGHFEGDTLVVDTTKVKVHPMSMVDPFGTPHTEKLHVVERYRLIADKDGKGLEVTIRVDDPGTFTRPWSGRLVYRPNPAQTIVEVNCSENNRDFEGKSFGPTPEEKGAPF